MLALEDITAGYGSTVVLRNVTITVPPSSVVALLGANGAGKTTLLRIAAGSLRPLSGTRRVDGVDMTRAKPHQLVAAGLCHIPEGRAVFKSLTVRENLLTQAVDRDADVSLERAVFAFPKLGQRLDQTAGTMSGGEQQMLALARAYVQQPRFVLLDEVSMGLAPSIVDEIFEFLGRLAQEGSSLLLVEQYVTRALEVADYVYLLNRGSVEFAGEPSELSADRLLSSYVGVEMTG